MAAPNIQTLKNLNDANVLKNSDPWGFALSKFSHGVDEMEYGDKLYKIPTSIPLDEYARQFPNAKYVSFDPINTPTKTERIFYIHDLKNRVIHQTRSVELKDDVIYVGRLPPKRISLFVWTFKKLFGRRLRTKHEARKH